MVNEYPYDLVLKLEIENHPELYFKDHMASYRALMSDLKNKLSKSKGKEVANLFKVATKRKLLAATTGNV